MSKTLVLFLASNAALLAQGNVVAEEEKSIKQGDSGPTCFQPGECSESLYIGHWIVDNVDQCLTECQNESECRYFTFYEDANECMGFLNCEVFSEDTCSNCYSGQQTCEGLKCWVPGQCDGVLLDQLGTESSQQCLEACQDNSDCEWFTHDSYGSICLLFESCVFLQTECLTCVSGQSLCSEYKIPDYTKIMVVVGYNDDDWTDTVEVIDLSDPTSVCAPVANYPLLTDRNAVGFVNGVVKSCGGYIGNGNNIAVCFDYNPSTNAWDASPDLINERYHAGSSIIDFRWLVTGDNYNAIGSTSELWTGTEFVMSVDLPEMMYSHCQVTVNSSHIFFGDCDDQTAYILDWSSKEWTQLGNMTYERHMCGCGLIHNDDQGLEVVVAAEGTSEIFNFGTMSWRDGPSIVDEYGFASVQLKDTFALVGGTTTSAQYSKKVFAFDQNNYEFVLLEQRLEHSRAFGGAVAVPDDIVHCVGS